MATDAKGVIAATCIRTNVLLKENNQVLRRTFSLRERNTYLLLSIYLREKYSLVPGQYLIPRKLDIKFGDIYGSGSILNTDQLIISFGIVLFDMLYNRTVEAPMNALFLDVL